MITETLNCKTVNIYTYTVHNINLSAYFHFKVLLILVHLFMAMYDLAFYNNSGMEKKTSNQVAAVAML